MGNEYCKSIMSFVNTVLQS